MLTAGSACAAAHSSTISSAVAVMRRLLPGMARRRSAPALQHQAGDLHLQLAHLAGDALDAAVARPCARACSSAWPSWPAIALSLVAASMAACILAGSSSPPSRWAASAPSRTEAAWSPSSTARALSGLASRATSRRISGRCSGSCQKASARIEQVVLLGGQPALQQRVGGQQVAGPAEAAVADDDALGQQVLAHLLQRGRQAAGQRQRGHRLLQQEQVAPWRSAGGGEPGVGRGRPAPRAARPGGRAAPPGGAWRAAGSTSASSRPKPASLVYSTITRSAKRSHSAAEILALRQLVAGPVEREQRHGHALAVVVQAALLHERQQAVEDGRVGLADLVEEARSRPPAAGRSSAAGTGPS